jgi:exodeoxyribonuclease-1
VLEQADGWTKVALTQATVEAHIAVLTRNPHFAENVRTALEGRAEFPPSIDPEAQLYDGFVNDRDRLRIEAVRNADTRTLADFNPEFSDERLAPLLLHYKARSYPMSLSEEESAEWEKWRAQHVSSQLPQFGVSLQKLMATETNSDKQFVLQELQLWAESIIPTHDE